ncbi:unnamed protein product [Gongylonema pulchrum]|uniref:BPI2 domain-containing protein n=1 Tax=Gongylonema pulchrum TaxID=637853 RepID=A0A183DE04_9BILA|nr:unnamed protein product [Gongylonema pulchrum]
MHWLDVRFSASFVKLDLSGYVKAMVNDIRVYLQTSLLVRDERPQIEVTDCSMDVDYIEVNVSGGIIPWIVNLFRKHLAAIVKRYVTPSTKEERESDWKKENGRNGWEEQEEKA